MRFDVECEVNATDATGRRCRRSLTVPVDTWARSEARRLARAQLARLGRGEIRIGRALPAER